MTTFLEKLYNACRSNRSLLCIGLDPVLERMPIGDIYEFNRLIIEATADLVCAYKPNLAFYEAHGIKGLKALEKTLTCIPSNIPVIGDAKRGDIGSTAEAYATAMFDIWGFDAVTVQPYLGRDSVQPFLDYHDKGVFVLCRTSNPSAREIQDIVAVPPLGGESRYLYELIATQVLSWNTAGNIGLVVGATYPDELATLRKLCPELPFLIPGIGAQGGDLERSIAGGITAEGFGAVVTASRQVLYASVDPLRFATAAHDVAKDLRERIQQVLTSTGVAWLSN